MHVRGRWGCNAVRHVCESGPMYGVDDISAVHTFLCYDYYYYSVELAKDESAGEELTAMFEADGLSREDTSSNTAPPVSAQPICS